MAGRPRRQAANNESSSTDTSRRAATECFNESSIRWIQESSILKPVDPRVSDQDWPCYLLHNATVYCKDGKTLVNPLLVQLHGPFIVRGILVLDQTAKKHLTRRCTEPVPIEITGSDQYSFGDHPVRLWVSGASGWFEIKPSRRFEPIFREIHEAVTLYYGIFDAYNNHFAEKSKKKGRKTQPSLDTVLFKYALKAGNGIFHEEAKALCHKWADFLIAHFPKEGACDGWSWENTDFAKWLRDSHPEVERKLANIVQEIAPPLPPPPPSPPSVIVPKASETSQPPRKRKGRPSKTANRPSDTREAKIQDSISSRSHSPHPKPATKVTPVPLPERYRSFINQPTALQTSQPTPARPVATSQSASNQVSGPSTSETADELNDVPMTDSDAESPVDRLLSVFRELAVELDISKASPSTVYSKLFFKCKMKEYGVAKDIVLYYSKELFARLGPEWKGTRFLKWLQEESNKPWVPMTGIREEDIPSQTYRRATKAATKVLAIHQPLAPLPRPINLHTKPDFPSQQSDEDISDSGVAFLRPRRGRKSGKVATLRPLPSTSRKRPVSELLEDVSSSSDDDVGDEVAAILNLPEDIAASGSRLPLPDGVVRVVVHAEPLMDTTPRGPNGTWTCEHEGCGYVVRAAEEQEGQDLIREHFRDHEAAAERAQLVVQESRSHGNIPINHLLEKIQAIGKASLLRKSKTTVNGEPVSQPVKRRILF